MLAPPPPGLLTVTERWEKIELLVSAFDATDTIAVILVLLLTVTLLTEIPPPLKLIVAPDLKLDPVRIMVKV